MINMVKSFGKPTGYVEIDRCDLIEYKYQDIKAFKLADIKFDNPSELGYTYIIVQIKFTNASFGKKKIIDGEIFEAVLLDPYLYAYSISDHYSGFIIRKHPTAFKEAEEKYLKDVKKYGYVTP